ncbi:hypothetical protein DL93DRAFT_2077752 [Clavulina sp. PMI_390]|nr:hypothetical protein DL93DRAFT_2077752 [Clavulina sp. PMI_390]
MGADLPPRAAPVNNMGSSGMPPVQRSGQLPPAAKAPEKPVDSVWANIPRAGTTAAAGRTPVPQHPPANNFASPQPSHSHAASRVLTLEEVEAEQRAAAQMARLSLAGAAQASPRPPAAVPSGMPEPARYAPSPLLPQAIPTSTDLEILRIAQQQNQQQQARQLFAQQHQQRQQDIFDQQQRQMQLEQQQQQQQFPSPMLAQQQQQQPPLRGGTPVDMQRFLQHHRSQSSLSQQGQQQPAHLAPAQPPRFAAQQFPPQSRPQQPHLQRQPDVGQIVPNENLTRMQIMESLTAGLPSHQQSQLPPLPPHAGDLMTELEGFAHTLPPEQRDALMAQAMHKIVEAERMEERNRRRQAKIRRISRYNELMTQSDKDFITRIQVSQLVTQDPYTEDFYAQVFGAINQTRMDNHNPRAPTNPNNVLSFGDGGGIGVLKVGERRSGRRENALNRMQNQIERIVSNAKKREALNQNQVNLQGALGKISGRSYKAAPRQALQVGSSLETREDTAAAAAKEGLEALAGVSGANQSPQKPLSKIQALMTIEAMYDAILDIEQLKRDQPPPNAEEAAQIAWLEKYNALVDKVWLESKIMVPVEVTPHPFISLLEPAKGKRLLPRFVSHLDGKRAQLFFTLFVVCYKQLDVVRMSPILDYPDTTPDKLEVEKQTDLFGNTVIQACEGVVRKAELRFVSGILGLLLDAGDVPVLANTLVRSTC